MTAPPGAGSAGEVARAFLRLGLTGFGGPIAHLAHFRRELVERRGWLGDDAYARLVAYAQFLPGPTSSQVGFLLGWERAGLAGALAAWCAFTLPSAAIMAAAAIAFGGLSGSDGINAGGGWLIGMRAAVLAIVAQAVLAMARALCPDPPRASIAAGAAIACILLPQPWVQAAILVPAGLAGLLLPPGAPAPQAAPAAGRPGARTAAACLGIAAALLAGVAAWRWWAPGPLAELAAAHLHAGSLVFGGGHVVLPLLRDPLVSGGLIDDDRFIAGYGAAQMMPGPLFSVAAWLGAAVAGWIGAAVALVAIFAPGLLLALGGLGAYRALAGNPSAQRLILGLNAGVVGILGAALWSPIGAEAARDPLGPPLALAAFVALAAWRAPAWAVVAGCCALAAALG